MSRPLDNYDRIAIAEIVIYSVLLVGAVILNIKHGITKSAGWRYLVILALARLIGSSMLLATVNDPANTSLYVGWLTLNGVGLGPLILMLLGLLGRLFESIKRQGREVVKPLYQRLIQLLMLVGMILLIVGGTNASYKVVDGMPKVDYTTESRVGTVLMIVVYALLVLEALLVFRNQGYIAQGENRLLLGVMVSLPFVAARLIYGCVIILGGESSTVWLYLGMSVIMEIVVVIICEIVGFSVAKAPPARKETEGAREMYAPASSRDRY